MEHVPETDEQARVRLNGARCDRCLYAVRPDGSDLLECRFKPPAISGYRFPTIKPGDWCGEFISKNS